MALISDCWKADTLILLTGILVLIYSQIRRIYSYWERKGFKTLPGFNYIFGHFQGMLTQTESIGDFQRRIYDSTDEPFIGIYSVLRPMILVRDPELVRSILIRDFAYFSDRGVHCNADYDILSTHLFALRGQQWKDMHTKLMPAFTYEKVKAMFPTLVDCGSKLQEHLDKLIKKGELLDVREVSAAYTTNFIASIPFGIDVDTVTNPNNDFRANVNTIFAANFMNAIRSALNFFAPKLMAMLRIKSVDDGVEEFILSLVKDNLENREQNNVFRKDFFQLLVQLRNTGSVGGQWENTIKTKNDDEKSLTIDEIAAQTFLFFAAGFGTISATLTFSLYELARNPQIQKRVHDEIDRVLEQHSGQITFESVADMKFLDACIDETSRKHCVLPVLNRTCVKDYQIPGTNKVIEKGIEVIISSYGLQMDAQYYEEPEKFNPDRFIDESAAASKPFMPFGLGPRKCIGWRFGKMQTKIGLLLMLQKFRFELEPKLKCQNIKYDAQAILLAPLGEINLQVLKR